MGYFSAQEAVSYFEKQRSSDFASMPNFSGRVTPPFISYRSDVWGDVSWNFNGQPITAEACEEWLNAIHERIADGAFLTWKSLRPWEVVDIASTLDPSKAWIGWEIETGWESDVSRSNVLVKFLDEYQWVCVDEEGPCYGAELTWCPREQDYYDDSNHPVLWVARLRNNHYDHDPHDHVGTHANISTPTYRDALSDEERTSVMTALNRSIMNLDAGQRDSLFGRSDMYAGFFTRCNSSSTSHWLEGKLFNSTYDLTVARDYITVANNLAMLIEELSQAVVGKGRAFGGVVLNFFEVLDLGAVPEIEIKKEGKVIAGYDIVCYDDEYDGGWEDEYCCEECNGSYEEWEASR